LSVRPWRQLLGVPLTVFLNVIIFVAIECSNCANLTSCARMVWQMGGGRLGMLGELNKGDFDTCFLLLMIPGARRDSVGIQKPPKKENGPFAPWGP